MSASAVSVCDLCGDACVPVREHDGYPRAMDNRFLSTPDAVAEAVRAGRAEKGISQAQLAAKAHVGRRFVIDLEAGHARAELGKVLDVLEALDIHAMALPAPRIDKAPEDVDLDEVIRRFA